MFKIKKLLSRYVGHNREMDHRTGINRTFNVRFSPYVASVAHRGRRKGRSRLPAQ